MSDPVLAALQAPRWPADLAALYKERHYWRGVDATEPVAHFAAKSPEKLAVVDTSGKSLTYGQLNETADRVASALVQWGLKRGDRFILQLPNVLELACLFLGSIRAGIIPVMVLPTHRDQEVIHLAQGSGAVAAAIADQHASYDFCALMQRVRAAVPSLGRILVVGNAGEGEGMMDYPSLMSLAKMPFQRPPLDPESVALLLHSGGTGGLPKLIPRTHNDYDYTARASAQRCGFDENTVYLAALSGAHNFPLACPGMLGAWSVGASVVLAREPSPDTVFALIEKYRVTVTAAVPTLVSLWLEAREFDESDLSSLTLLQVGGAKLAPSLAKRIHEWPGVRVNQVFGMAEGLLNFTDPDDPIALIETTQGRPLSPDDELRIVNEEGQPVGEGEVGELWTRGPYTIRAYLAGPEINGRAFTADGFYRTGDMVRRLPSGHLVVEGRSGDQINRGGEKFSAVEIENHLIDHPAIRDIAVLGVPDADLGQASLAFICPVDQPPSLRDLKDFLRKRGLATYKLPDRLQIIDAIPLTRFGKIDRKLLAKMAAETGVA